MKRKQSLPEARIPALLTTCADSAYEDGDDAFTDFTIVSGEKEYKVHRLVIAAQSDFFRKLLRSPFKESSDRSVTLHDDPAVAVEMMIEFMYTGRYRYANKSELAAMAFTKLDAMAFIIGDKYGISALRECAVRNFEQSDTEELLMVIPYLYNNGPSATRTCGKQ